jgi:hypothetical protein
MTKAVDGENSAIGAVPALAMNRRNLMKLTGTGVAALGALSIAG